MAHGETVEHRRLKALALAWARAHGWAIAATEVRVPKSGFRADVAAYAPRRGTHARGDDPLAGTRTAVFECKQARADLLKDSHAEAATRGRLAALQERRAKLEELLAVHRPDLRKGESLFPEFDAWDFSGLEHRTYREVLAELATAQARVLHGTKFSKMFRYRCADALYLVAEDGIFAPAEIPAGWGLLVRRDEGLELARPPVALESSAAQRLALLENIAQAATRGQRDIGEPGPAGMADERSRRLTP